MKIIYFLYFNIMDLTQLNKKISELEKENKEIKEILKNVLKHGDYNTVKFILSIVKSNISKM